MFPPGVSHFRIMKEPPNIEYKTLTFYWTIKQNIGCGV